MMLYNLAQRIRKLREKNNLTREKFCGDETELSVRHLARIEKGDVLPSLTILSFIAKKLQVDINELIDSKYLKKYNALKVELESLTIEMNEKSEQKAAKVLLTILTEYYDIMPQDEQMYVECTLASYITRIYQDTTYAKLVLEKYSAISRNKNIISYNEYAYYALYIWIAIIEERAIDIQEIEEKSIMISTYEGVIQSEIFIRLRTNISTYYLENNQYEVAEVRIDEVLKLIRQFKVYKRLPLAYMIKAKCSIQCNEVKKAKENYRKAIELCELLGLNDLNAKIGKEYIQDIEKIE